MCTLTQKSLCTNDCTVCFNRSFASQPRAKYWLVDKNKGLLPREAFKGSGKKYWFKCEDPLHPNFSMKLDNILKGGWCQLCGRKKISAKMKLCTDINKSFAKHAKAHLWNYELNNSVKPENVYLNSNDKYWFKCDKCFHDFDTSPNHTQIGCPYCAHQKLCNDHKCKICFDKSLASQEMAKWFSPKNIDASGKRIEPRDLFKSSGKTYLFFHDCGIDHEFRASLDNVFNGRFCPYCAIPGHQLCENDCQNCFTRSFASTINSKFLDPAFNARNLFKFSNKEYYFFCPCGHSFPASLNSVSQGTWCPYCCEPSQKLCEKSDCEQCYNKSFASSKNLYMWVDVEDPRKVFKRSDSQMYNFKCKFGHLFQSYARNVDSNEICIACKNKTQKKLSDWLKGKIPSDCDVVDNKTFDWCIKIRPLPFDICIDKLKLIIELDGDQHFEQIANWTSPELTRENDVYKMQRALVNGYSVIRILQTDVWFDQNNWQDSLIPVLRNYDNPTVIYLDHSNKYEQHQTDMSSII
jgi:very-short-patch-repair endonuclease